MVKTRHTALVVAIFLTVALGLGAPTSAVAAPTLPFLPRFSINANGAIVTIGNNLMTCPDSNANCAAAKAGKAPNNNNNAYDMVNLDADTDPSTFNSSMSTLNLPAGATVEWAGLYWGARLTAGVNGVAGNANAINQMSLRVPGASAYQAVAADTSAGALFGPYSAGNNAYQRYADVTAIVAAAGSGDYWGANVVGGTGQDRYAGWSLVVVYDAPGLPLRNLTVFDGFTNVGASSPQTITVSGFQAPLSGPVDTTLTMVAYEGDMTQTGDFTKLNGAQLATATSPGSNFFNSTNDWFGTSVASRTPNDKNMLGFDIKNIGASGIIGNGDTSATFTFGSTGDAYYPGVLTTAINLYAPDFTASSKTAVDLNGNSPAQPGDVIQYNVNYVNSGQDPATGLVSTDPLPPGTEYVPNSLRLVTSAGATVQALTDDAGDDVGEIAGTTVQVRLGTGATATAGGTLDVGASASYSFQARVLTAAAGTTVTNTAHLAYTTGTTKISANYDTPPVAIDVQSQADMQITKTMTPALAANGSPITVTLQVTNNGPNTATGVQVTDPVPNGFSDPAIDVTGAPAGTECSTVARVVTCDLPDLPDGGVATITLTGAMPPDTPASQTTMTNVAQVTTTTYDPDLSNNTAASVITLTPQADLSVTKTTSSPTTPGGTVTYTLTATNNGPSDASRVVLVDTVGTPSTLSLSGVTPGGFSCGTVSAGGVTCTLASLAAGASATVTVTGQVAPGAAEGATITNQATVSSSTTDPDVSNNTATATNTVGAPSADVRVTKVAFPATLIAGGPVAYTITATNWGPSDATNVVVDDTLPASVVINSATNSRGTCTVSGQSVNCNVGTLLASLDATKPGSSATITVFGSILSTATGATVENTATVQSGSADPDMTNNQSTTTTPLTAQADLAVSKTATTTTLPATGDKVLYTITVVNNGPSDAQNVTIDDTLPDGLQIDPTNHPSAACDANLHCTLGTLAANASMQITVPTVATANGSGTMVETVTASTDTTDPNIANNTATWTLSGDPQADLQLEKTASPAPLVAGGTATYVLTVTNNGPNSSVPEVTDTLPDGLTPTVATGDGTTSTCSISGQTVTCHDTDPLADGAKTNYTITANVSPELTDGSSLTNTAHTDSFNGVADPSMGNNDATVTSLVQTTTNLKAVAMTWNGFTSFASGPGTVVTSTPNGTFVWLTMMFTNDGTATAQNTSFVMNYDLNMTNLAISGAPIVAYWNPTTGKFDPYTTEPGCQLIQSQIVCPLLGGTGGAAAILPGQSVTISMLLAVRGDTPSSGKGWVTVATTTSEGDPTIYPDNYTDNYAEQPLAITSGLSHLTVTKTAATGIGPNGALVAGGTFSYTIQVYQQGQIALGAYWSAATNVVVTDGVTTPLPSGFHITGVTTSQGTCDPIPTGGASISCNVGTVAGTFLLPATQPGPAATITITGTIDTSATPGTAIPNIAYVTTDSATYPTPGPFTAEADVDVVAQADLQLSKQVDATPTTDAAGNPVYFVGSQVGYTLTALNAGPSNSGASTITDTLPLGLTLDTANSPGCQITIPGDVTTGTQEVITCAVTALSPGASQSVRVVANTSPLDNRLPGTGPGCVPGAPQHPWEPAGPVNPPGCDQYPAHPRQIDNTATIAETDQTGPSDPDLTNNTATATAVLDVQADIAITATPSTSTPAAGDTVTYTAVSINNGPSAGDFPLGDVTFPPGFVPISWDVPGNVCTTSLDATTNVTTLNCQAIAVPPLFLVFLPGQAVTSVVTVQIPPDTPAGTYTATGHTYSQTPDPNPDNNWVSVPVDVRQVSDLSITKTLTTPTPLVAGDDATYELTVTNTGPSVANDIVISDTIPAGMTYVSATDPTGALCPDPQTENGDTVLLCDAGTLTAGGAAVVTVTFNVNADAPAQLCNTALVGSASSDPVADDNQSTACADVTTPPAPPTPPTPTPPTPTPPTPPNNPVSPTPNPPAPQPQNPPTPVAINASTGGALGTAPAAWWVVLVAAAAATAGLALWRARLGKQAAG